jgi:glycosyltransferase involved in cell wall biosynthesis
VRILAVGNIFPPHDFGGGYEAVWEAAVHHLTDRGHSVRVLTTDHRTSVTAPERADVHRALRWYWHDHAFPARTLRESLAIERANLRELARHREEFDPELVSWWSMGGLSMSMLEWTRRAGLPAAAFVHDDWLDYGRRADAFHRRVRKRRYPAAAIERLLGVPGRVAFGAAAHYAFVSQTTRAHAAESGLVLPHTSVVPSGIAARFVPAAPRDWEGRLLCVGRVEPRKGVATAIEALPHLPTMTLKVVGGGPAGYTAELSELAESLGVRARVEFAGPCPPSDLPGEYAAADAVIFPVIWKEPWGLVPLEAMATGRPVVATGRGGSGEYLVDGVNALLFPAEDAEALAARVQRLAREPDLRASLRDRGIEKAENHRASGFNDEVERTLATVLAGP